MERDRDRDTVDRDVSVQLLNRGRRGGRVSGKEREKGKEGEGDGMGHPGCTQETLMTWRYVWKDNMRHKRGLIVGVASVLLVVMFLRWSSLGPSSHSNTHACSSLSL